MRWVGGMRRSLATSKTEASRSAPGEPLDAHIFEIAKDRRMPPTDKLSSLDRHKLKQRIWHVGNILMKMHNCLQLRGEFIALSPLLRKCCQRIKYILSDDINANVDENAILAVHESDDDDDAAPPPDDDAAAKKAADDAARAAAAAGEEPDEHKSRASPPYSCVCTGC